MQIIRSTRRKVCVDGSLMKEFVLDEPLSDEFLAFLRHFGEVKVLEHMRSPFFDFEKEHFLSIKGIIGDTVVEVRYKAIAQDFTADYFHLLLSYFRSGDDGVKKLTRIESTIMEKIAIRRGDPPAG